MSISARRKARGVDFDDDEGSDPPSVQLYIVTDQYGEVDTNWATHEEARKAATALARKRPGAKFYVLAPVFEFVASEIPVEVKPYATAFGDAITFSMKT